MSRGIDTSGTRSAFPCHADENGTEWGITIRDYFAAHATEYDIDCYTLGAFCDTIVANSNGTKSVERHPQRRSLAEAKYAYADAMLEARK